MAKSKSVKPPPEDKAKREHDHLAAIMAMGKECDALAQEHECDKKAAKESKEALDEKLDELRSLIRTGPNPQMELPFKPVVTPQSWESVPIGTAMKLSDRQKDLLESAGVKTVGEFESLRGKNRKDYPDGLLSLKGVGEKTITKWEDEILDWLGKNRKPA